MVSFLSAPIGQALAPYIYNGFLSAKTLPYQPYAGCCAVIELVSRALFIGYDVLTKINIIRYPEKKQVQFQGYSS